MEGNITWYLVFTQKPDKAHIFGVLDDEKGSLHPKHLRILTESGEVQLCEDRGIATSNLFFNANEEYYTLADLLQAGEKNKVYITELPATLVEQVMTAVEL